MAPGTVAAVAGLAVIAGLALIGGLAAACFTKAFGIVFLGEPRSGHAAHAHEAGPALRWPMVLLAAACLVLGLGAPWLPRILSPVLVALTRLPNETMVETLDASAEILKIVSITALALAGLIAALALLRRRLLAKRNVRSTVTWDCGYARPTARMQYTSSSFAQPLTFLFRALLRSRVRVEKPAGLFPARAALATETPDLCHGELYRPAFLKVNWALAKLRWLQHGKVQLYVLYIALTLLLLMIWKLR